MLKNKDFKYIYFNAGNQCYHRKVVCQVNLEIPLAVNRLISVRGLRAVAIKHLVELSVEHEFFATFFLREKLVMVIKNYSIRSHIFTAKRQILIKNLFLNKSTIIQVSFWNIWGP